MTDTDDPAPSVRRAGLRREITGLLAVKLLALTVLYFAFFGPSSRPHITAPDLAAHLTSAPAPTH